jgi:hypothetical protein
MFEELLKNMLHYFLSKSSYLKKIDKIDITYTININIYIVI